MAESNFIGLEFRVAGGVSGTSAQNIQRDLRTIVDKAGLEVTVKLNKEAFQKEIGTMIAEARKQLASLGGVSVTGSGGTSGKSSKASATVSQSAQAAQAVSREQQAVFELSQQIDKLNAAKIKLYKTNPRNGEAFKQEAASVEKLTNELSGLQQKYSDLVFTGAKTGSGALETTEFYNTNVLGRVNATDNAKAIDAQSSAVSRLSANFKKAQSNAQQLVQRYQKLIQFSPEAASMANNLTSLANAKLNTDNLVDGTKQVDTLKNRTAEVSKEMSRLEVETGTVGRRVSEAFDSRVINLFAFALGALVTGALSKVYTNVVALDNAVTNLQIATGKTREETRELLGTYGDLAQELGATVTEVAEGADTWLRQGYEAQEAGDLIYASMMLAKLGQLDSAEASTALTSALKGYKLEVEDATSVVDKFTAVDMEAAIGAGDIATAMAETAAGADLAGVSMDRLIGYIATVGEVTQDAPESVGTFFRTILARMSNIAAGKMIDDETGESLNDVEQTLKNVGIALRGTDGQFRDFSAVLDDLGAKWETLNSLEQHQVATAIAGTRQQEKLIVLMENYGKAVEYASVAANSLGTAQEKFDSAYLESIEAQTNKLTAAWQEFSATVLESDSVKSILSLLTDFVNLLAAITSNVDILNIVIPMLGGVIGGTLLGKIQAAAISMNKLNASLSSLAMVASVISGIVSGIENNWAKAIAGLIAGMAAFSGAIITAFVSIDNATKTMPWVQIIQLGIAGITLLASGYSALIDLATGGAQRAADSAKKAYEEAKSYNDEEKKETEDLISLMKEYEDIRSEIEKSEKMSAEQRSRILEIQSQITSITGQESKNLDLINGSLDENLKKLRELAKLQASQQYQTALGAYGSSLEKYDAAYEKSEVEIGGIPGFTLGQYDIVFDVGNDEEPYTEEIAGILYDALEERDLLGYILSETDGFGGLYNKYDDTLISNHGFGDYYAGIVLKDDVDPKAMVDALDSLIEEMVAQGYAISSPELYNRFLEYRDAWQQYITDIESSGSELLEAVTNLEGFNLDIDDIETQEDYDSAFNLLYGKVMEDENVLELIADEIVTADDVKQAVIDWLGKFYDFDFDESGNVSIDDAGKNFLDFANDVGDAFEILKNALESFEEGGIVSADAMEELLGKYPELEKYFKLVEDGYIPAIGDGDAYEGLDDIGILYDWGESFLQPYVDAVAACTEGTEEWEIATQNLADAKAYLSTLMRPKEIEKEQEILEAEIEALEKQLDQYKELIDERKDLLKSYEEEISYQEELAEKQDNVAKLQTQLALARLDTSAAGQARARELEEELREAQEELDDFTLEHAIDVLTEQLDNGLEDYESFIEGQIDRIETAIENLKFTVDPNPTVPEPSDPETDSGSESGTGTDLESSSTPDRWLSHSDAEAAGASDVLSEFEWLDRRIKPYGTKSYQDYLDLMFKGYYGRAPKYHSGGFVDGVVSGKSNEVFAKLLRGEFVSTPKQMDNFVNSTLPNLVSGGASSATYNAPLVSINCGSVTQETLPAVEAAVKAAVKDIKSQIDSAFSRTGYKRPVNKFPV